MPFYPAVGRNLTKNYLEFEFKVGYPGLDKQTSPVNFGHIQVSDCVTDSCYKLCCSIVGRISRSAVEQVIVMLSRQVGHHGWMKK
jgi:hypothetical protein